jgi:hypothetical protein
LHYDTALNLLWLLLGAVGLLATACSNGKRTWLRVVRVAVVVAVVFPFLSASDDLLCIEQAARPGGAGEHVVRLYTNMESPLAASAPQIRLALFFILLVAPLLTQRLDRSTPIAIGRSPPALPIS